MSKQKNQGNVFAYLDHGKTNGVILGTIEFETRSLPSEGTPYLENSKGKKYVRNLFGIRNIEGKVGLTSGLD